MWLYTDLPQAFKGEPFSSVFSTDGTLISASAAPHCLSLNLPWPVQCLHMLLLDVIIKKNKLILLFYFDINSFKPGCACSESISVSYAHVYIISNPTAGDWGAGSKERHIPTCIRFGTHSGSTDTGASIKHKPQPPAALMTPQPALARRRLSRAPRRWH